MKVDLKRELAAYSARVGRFDVVTVPVLQYLMIDGHGDPNTSAEYRDAITTIFPVAYALKFFSKRELDRDYTVMPLEALWWADDMASFTTARDKSRWSWTALNLVPDWLTAEHVDAAVAATRAKGVAPAALPSTPCASSPSTRACACRPCTWAPMTTRPRCSRDCMTRSSRHRASR